MCSNYTYVMLRTQNQNIKKIFTKFRSSNNQYDNGWWCLKKYIQVCIYVHTYLIHRYSYEGLSFYCYLTVLNCDVTIDVDIHMKVFTYLCIKKSRTLGYVAQYPAFDLFNGISLTFSFSSVETKVKSHIWHQHVAIR